MTNRLAAAACFFGFALSIAADARAVCNDIGVVQDVRGSGATLERNARIYRLAPGNTICAGDKLSAGSSGEIIYTVYGRQGRLTSNSEKSFAASEGQVQTALDADDVDPPHNN